MVKGVLAVIGDVEIRETVVVVIPHRDTDTVVAVSGIGQAGFFGHIGESAVGILAVEAVPVFGVTTIKFFGLVHGAGEVAAIYEEDVEQAVVVVIKEGDAAAHGFD